VKAKVFSKALLYHLQWKVSLREFLHGEGDFDVAELSPENCEFGKWLRSGETAKYASNMEVQEIERVHTWLHKTAKRVYELKMSGADTAALQELRKMETSCMRLASLLTTLKILMNNN
jgi:hypothetical protein